MPAGTPGAATISTGTVRLCPAAWTSRSVRTASVWAGARLPRAGPRFVEPPALPDPGRPRRRARNGGP